MIYEGILGPHEGFQTLQKEPSDFPGRRGSPSPSAANPPSDRIRASAACVIAVRAVSSFLIAPLRRWTSSCNSTIFRPCSSTVNSKRRGSREFKHYHYNNASTYNKFGPGRGGGEVHFIFLGRGIVCFNFNPFTGKGAFWHHVRLH